MIKLDPEYFVNLIVLYIGVIIDAAMKKAVHFPEGSVPPLVLRL